jgi:hypothetical protein
MPWVSASRSCSQYWRNRDFPLVAAAAAPRRRVSLNAFIAATNGQRSAAATKASLARNDPLRQLWRLWTVWIVAAGVAVDGKSSLTSEQSGNNLFTSSPYAAGSA